MAGGFEELKCPTESCTFHQEEHAALASAYGKLSYKFNGQKELYDHPLEFGKLYGVCISLWIWISLSE